MSLVLATVGFDERDAGVARITREVAGRLGLAVGFVHAVAEDEDVAGVTTKLEAMLQPGERVWVEAGELDEVVGAVSQREGAAFLIIGRARSRGGEVAWGKHSRTILRSPGCPVLVVPRGVTPTWAFARVGMDLSRSAFEALDLAQRLCDRVEAVAVLSADAVGADAADADLRARFREGMADHGDADVPLRAVVGGSPGDSLLADAQGVDLLCVGSRGLSPLAATFLGSTAERVAARASVPVLVVRRRGDARGIIGALFGP
jgi:nucleotide-binding universal stress UspA family protein